MSWEGTTELADSHETRRDETPEAEGKFGPLKKKKPEGTKHKGVGFHLIA